jgi:hypothetical protein
MRAVSSITLSRSRSDVIGLVSDHVHDHASGALLGLVHEQLQFLRASDQTIALRQKLLATKELKFAEIGKDRKRITGRKRVSPWACCQKSRNDEAKRSCKAHGPTSYSGQSVTKAANPAKASDLLHE